LLGNDAVCSLHTEWSSVEEPLITVQLAPSSTIPRDGTLSIQRGLWEWFRVDGRQNNSAVTIPFNDPCPVSARTPIIDLYVPFELGLCDDLEFDLRAGLSNLGGRAPVLFAYNISLNDTMVYVENEKYVVIESDRIDELETGSYVLSVYSWLEEFTTQSDSFMKLDIPIPSIQLSYPTTFDAYTDVVHIGSVITFNAACLSPPIAGTFVYMWSAVFVEMINGSDAFNSSMFAELQRTVNENGNASLTIANDGALLQKGATYEFVLNAECDGMQIECLVTSSEALISYQYSPISCQIAGGDYKTLNVSLPELDMLTLEFDGAEWTFDPDANALLFEWQCYDELSALDCSHWFMSNVTSRTNSIRFNRTWYSDATSVSYGYTITLTVRDANIASRAWCVTSQAVVLNIIEPIPEWEQASRANYLLSVTTTSTSVSKSDNIRLIARFIYLNGTQIVLDDEDDSDDDEYGFLFEWSTADDALTIAQIENYRVNAIGAKNLVLNASQLEMGKTYSFVLNVYRSVYHTDVSLHSLARSAVSVHITTEPLIYDDGFLIYPELCVRSFDHFVDSLFHPYSVFVSADAQATPITFEFKARLSSSSADVLHYLHSPVLYQARLRNFVLPIDDNLELSVTVTDFTGASVSTTMQCGLSVTNVDHDNDCFSYTSAVLDAYFALTDPDELFSTAQTYAYVLQSSFSLLHYLENIGDTDCRFQHFSETMTALYAYFDPSETDLCAGTDYLFVIELAQTLTEWLTVGVANDEDDFLVTYFSEPCANFDAVYSLLTQALDPCRAIRDIVLDSNRVLVTKDSVITNRIIVLYDEVDITQQLSVLLTDTKNFPLLYNLMRAYMDSLSALNAMNADCLETTDVSSIIAFVERVLLISGVSSISITIPSEFTNFRVPNLEVLTIRDEQISSLNVTVNDMAVSLVKNPAADVDENDDLIMYGVTQNSRANVNYSGSQANNNVTGEGTLGAQILSIKFVNSTLSDGDIDVNMTFNVSDRWSNLERAYCVWWNEAHNTWDTAGCIAMFYLDDELMSCQCSHLTTFAIVYHLKVSAADPIKLAIQNEPLYGTLMLAFGISFLLLLTWIVFNMVRLRTYDIPMSKILSQVPMRILLMVAFLCLIQGFICVMSFSYKYVDFDASKSLILFFLLSLFVYYVVFTVVVTTWMSIAHSMHESDAVLRFKKSIKFSSVLIAVIYLALFLVLLFFDDNASVVTGINVGAIAWTCLMTFWVLLSTCYGYKVTALLYSSNKAVSGSNANTRGTSDVLKRISVAVTGLNLFFLTQCIQTAYFTFDPQALTVGWRLFDLVTHFVCLASICFLYHRSFNSLLLKEGCIDKSYRGSSRDTSSKGSGKVSKGSSKRNKDNKDSKMIARTFSAESSTGGAVMGSPTKPRLAYIHSTEMTATEDQVGRQDTLSVAFANHDTRKITDFEESEQPSKAGAIEEVTE